MRSFIRQPFSILRGKPDIFRLINIVDSAHRAANPAKYPVSEEVKQLYPAYEGIEGRTKPTTVHLQVYDGTHLRQLSFFFLPNVA